MWGLISAISLPIGAFIGLYKKPPAKVSATMMSFGAGALLFALSIELFGRTIAQKEHFEHEAEYNKIILVMAACAVLGGFVFSALDHVLNNAGGFLRKLSTLRSDQARDFIQRMLSDKTVKALQSTHVFRNVPENGLKQLLPYVQKLTFVPDGGPIYTRLDPDDPIYFVVSGKVEIKYHTPQGEELLFASREVLRDQIFGHQALTVQKSVLTSALPLTSTVCLRIAKSDLDEVMQLQKARPLAHAPQTTLAIQKIAGIKDDIPAASVVGLRVEEIIPGTALQDLSHQEVKDLYESAFEDFVEEEEDIFHELDSMSSIFFILHGLVKTTDADGTTNTLSAGQVLGWQVLDITAGRMQPRRFVAQALRDTVMLRLRRDELTRLLAKHAQLAEGLLAAGQWQPPARRASVGGMPEEEAAGAECEVSAREGAVGGGVGDAKQRGEHVALQDVVYTHEKRKLVDQVGDEAEEMDDSGDEEGSHRARGRTNMKRDRHGGSVHRISQEFAAMFKKKNTIFTEYRNNSTDRASGLARRTKSTPTKMPHHNRISADLVRDETGAMPAPGTATPDEVPESILDEDEIAAAVGDHVNKDKNTAIMIWVGILLDAIPESLVIGFIVTEGSRNPLVFVVGVFLSNFPEAMASGATMKTVGLATWKIMALWSTTCILTGIGAMIGSAIIPDSGLTGDFEVFVKGMEGLAAGAMLTMIAQTMLPEACEKGGGLTGIGCLLGFLSALLVSLIPFG